MQTDNERACDAVSHKRNTAILEIDSLATALQSLDYIFNIAPSKPSVVLYPSALVFPDLR
jgi:hypothetical protein